MNKIYPALIVVLAVLGPTAINAAERIQLREITYGSQKLKYSSELLEEPTGCLATAGTDSQPCAFRVGPGRKLAIKLEKQTLVAGDNTIVIREAVNRFRLVEGFLRVQGEKNLIIVVSSSANASKAASVQGDGEFFVERYGNEVSVVNTGKGQLTLMTGQQEEGLIGTGMEVRFTKLDRRTGRYEIGAPVPFELESQVVKEAKLFALDKSQFASRIDELLAMQQAAARLTAQIHSQAVTRKIASLERAAQRRRQIAMQREAEDRRLRALFRKKVLSVE